jgi:hypothetical protein
MRCNKLPDLYHTLHKLPEDIMKLLLIVFQMTSVPDFKEFLLLEKQHKQHAILCRTGGSVNTLEPKDIFTLTESFNPAEWLTLKMALAWLTRRWW